MPNIDSNFVIFSQKSILYFPEAPGVSLGGSMEILSENICRNKFFRATRSDRARRLAVLGFGCDPYSPTWELIIRYDSFYQCVRPPSDFTPLLAPRTASGGPGDLVWSLVANLGPTHSLRLVLPVRATIGLHANLGIALGAWRSWGPGMDLGGQPGT